MPGPHWLDVADDADDLGFNIEFGDVDVLADGVLVGEPGLREYVIDVDDNRRVLVIVR